jgi:arylsulfatase A-like enzyme
VPLFLKLPGSQMHGSAVTQWVQSVDLMPSVLKLAGVTLPKGVQGQDLFAGNDHALAEESHEGNVLRALRMKRGGVELKLITANENNPRGLAETELYQIEQDPGEKVNVAAEDPALTTVLRSTLDEHEQRAAQGRASQHSVDLKANAAATEKLRALGYAGGDK